jgi:hypothetical protein
MVRPKKIPNIAIDQSHASVLASIMKDNKFPSRDTLSQGNMQEDILVRGLGKREKNKGG